MQTERRLFGNRGEDLAAAYFEERGFRVIDRNWSCRLGEIDLILKKGEVLHFVEVKTRHTRDFGHPEEGITRGKLAKLKRAIQLYLLEHASPDAVFRVDALAILAEPEQEPEITYIENIFG